MPKAVQFDNYGGLEVLEVRDVVRPALPRGRVLVRVKAAGINPGESAIRAGAFAKRWPATFPSGQGSDFAGIVEEVGEAVTSWRRGDEVVGFTNERASQAEFVAVPSDQLTARPPNVPWEQAGALFVAGTTAYSAVRAVSLKPGDTLVVSGAAGGVGSIAVQLATRSAAKVIGLASPSHHKWLQDHGVIPVAYGDGTAAGIRAVSGQIDAFIDTYGHGYVDLAIDLGVTPSRIDTIIDFAAAQKHDGVKTAGSQEAANIDVLSELVALMAAGRLEIPISKVYPLSSVRDAYRELELRHARGKIVLVP
ncbi:MAG: NADP-dependent oxidoreductase [Polyangiaceae bacterium]|jgi:NADPH:quinone reductase-like Zn-dependent oxidoreductase